MDPKRRRKRAGAESDDQECGGGIQGHLGRWIIEAEDEGMGTTRGVVAEQGVMQSGRGNGQMQVKRNGLP
jgi:hypothetical protein